MRFNLFKNKEKNANLNSKFNERTREKSTGRSMVEMLGVLAIIGVLSIGGISGYTLAMRRYKSNEIITVAEKYAFILYENALAQSDLYDFLDFSESGLGALPSGLKSIQPSNGGDLIDESKGWTPHFSIIHKNSGDLISLELELDSKELCQIINNMADRLNDACQGEKYSTLISFYVN